MEDLVWKIISPLLNFLIIKTTPCLSTQDLALREGEKEFIDSIQEVVDLNDNYLVKYKDPKLKLDRDLDNGFSTHNINIAIASAVTAYARIHMSNFKNNPYLPNLYYTDSLYFDTPLPDSFIDSKVLGKLKLGGVFDVAIFLAPKVYALKNKEEERI